MPSISCEVMLEKQYALDRLELRIRWGQYDIHVLRFHMARFSPGKVIGFHKHSEFEFHFIPQGKGKVIIADQEYALRPGMFYLTGPDVMHYQEADPYEAMDELCLHVDIIDRGAQADKDNANSYDEWEASEAQNCMRNIASLPLFPTIDVHNAMPLFLEAYHALNKSYIGSYTTIKQNVIQILLRAVRAYDTANEQEQLPTRDMKAYRYQLAMEYMYANYNGMITLEDVAEKLNLSTRHIQRLFKELHHGHTFSHVLEDIRLKAVCRQLQSTTQSVEKIAKLSGFAGGNYLHAVFRKKFGITPSEYRKSEQLKNYNMKL